MTVKFSTSLNKFATFIFFLFVLITLFDPMDKLLGMKVETYSFCMFLLMMKFISSNFKIKLPKFLIIIIALLLFIPLQSILYYFVINGNPKYAGFLLFKSYLFCLICFYIYVYGIDSFKHISYALNILAISIVSLFLFVNLYPEMINSLSQFGSGFKIFDIDPGRNYGGNINFFQMYFLTSPMLVISIGYYFNKIFSDGFSIKLFLILLMNIIAMFLAGTRNNMIISLILPIFLFFQYSSKTSKRSKILIFILFSILISTFLIYFKQEFFFLFDPNEKSNISKLTTLKDYLEIFSSDVRSLIFGKGLGSYEAWSNRSDSFMTELTYLEIVRSYGIFIGFILITIMFYPLLISMIIKNFNQRWVFFPYLFYLVMTATNPLFFSSMGMLFFSAYISSIAIHLKRIKT